MTHNDQCERIVELIEMLVADEGAELSIACPNPDFDGPQRIIDVCDQWTDWDNARFEGDTLQEALEAALTSRQAGENRDKLKRMYGLSFGMVDGRKPATIDEAVNEILVSWDDWEAAAGQQATIYQDGGAHVEHMRSQLRAVLSRIGK